MIRPHTRSQSGFIITVELILIFTIVILATLVALAGVRNALIDSGIAFRRPLVFDSAVPDAQLVGKVVDFDDSETARVLRLDPNDGLTILLGVRSDRFATHTPVFYSADDCTGTAYVHDPSSFGAPLNLAVEQRFGFFDELTGVVYAAGAGGPIVAGSPFGPGLLYRNDPLAVSSAPSTTSVYLSAWELADDAGGPPPATAAPWVSSPLSPCRDLPTAGRDGLVPALEVLDPDTTMNVLTPFVPPFGAR